MKKHLLALLFVSVSTSASANTYIRATAGVAADLPEIRDFERRCYRPNPKTGACNIWHSRVESDTEAPTTEVAVGKDLNFLRVEMNLGYVRVGPNRAGCIDCKGGNTGSNGAGPYSPEKQEGATDIGTLTLNVLGNLPVTDQLSLSAAAGAGAAYYHPHTAYPDNGGRRQMHATVEPMWRLIGEVRYRVSDRLEAGLRWTRDDLGSRRVDFGDFNNTLSRVNEPVRYHTATAGVTYRLGK